MTEQMTTSSGVQELIARIRDQGVKSGQDEAERIIAEARETAEALIREAKAEATALRQKTQAKIAADKAAAEEALKLAARDTNLELQGTVVSAFERQVTRLVSSDTRNPEFLQALVLVLAGKSAEEYITDKDIQVLVSNLGLGQDEDPEIEERARRGTLMMASDMLREGVELIPADDVQGGVRVRVVDEDLEIDLTSDAIARLILRYMLPRFRALLAGAE